MANAFPLQWPDGWTRTKLQRPSRFKATGSTAQQFLHEELHRLGAVGVVVSTNLPLKPDGTIRLDKEPVDPGVAVYFQHHGKQMVFACDQYEGIADNLQAIAKTIEAIRGIERWGASELMERAFSGFKRLTATAGEGEDCWKVLNLSPMSPANLVTLVHRDLIRKLHAKQSSSEEFARVNVARDDALRALKAAESYPEEQP
jgi:hypothetical protein